MPAPQRVLPYQAILAIAKSVIRFGILLVSGRVHKPTRHVGGCLTFTDGASARVFRETVVDQQRCADPAVLVVEFRLRVVHGWMHKLFQAESVLHTPLFAGFPGFITKLWLADDENEVYRGIYEWDGADRAESYAQVLCWLLRPFTMPGSVDYRILAGEDRAGFIAESECLTNAAPVVPRVWWRPA